MAMNEKDHQAEVRAMKAHNAPSSGCVIRCISNYVENNAHSHRWNAAEQARAETKVYTMPMDEPWEILRKVKNKLLTLAAEGALAAGITRKGSNWASKVKPFYRMFIPFPHNAHHIVPMGVLWAEVIDKAVAKAKENPGKMFKLVIKGFLTEPYNHNDRPNMITLPTRVKESETLKLPMHLAEKAKAHPVYSTAVATQVKAEVPPLYDSLASAVNDKKHPVDDATVEVKQILVDISEATYKAIISLAKSTRAAGRTLDEMASEIAKRMAANLAR